jgi:hypothetical protein
MDLGKLIQLSALLCPFLLSLHFRIAGASAHIYSSQPFHDVGNSLLLYGGSEGIFASSRSLIRYILWITFSTLLMLSTLLYSSSLLTAGLRTSLSGGQLPVRATAAMG